MCFEQQKTVFTHKNSNSKSLLYQQPQCMKAVTYVFVCKLSNTRINDGYYTEAVEHSASVYMVCQCLQITQCMFLVKCRIEISAILLCSETILSLVLVVKFALSFSALIVTVTYWQMVLFIQNSLVMNFHVDIGGFCYFRCWRYFVSTPACVTKKFLC